MDDRHSDEVHRQLMSIALTEVSWRVNVELKTDYTGQDSCANLRNQEKSLADKKQFGPMVAGLLSSTQLGFATLVGRVQGLPIPVLDKNQSPYNTIDLVQCQNVQLFASELLFCLVTPSVSEKSECP